MHKLSQFSGLYQWFSAKSLDTTQENTPGAEGVGHNGTCLASLIICKKDLCALSAHIFPNDL